MKKLLLVMIALILLGIVQHFKIQLSFSTKALIVLTFIIVLIQTTTWMYRQAKKIRDDYRNR